MIECVMLALSNSKYIKVVILKEMQKEKKKANEVLKISNEIKEEKKIKSIELVSFELHKRHTVLRYTKIKVFI